MSRIVESLYAKYDLENVKDWHPELFDESLNESVDSVWVIIPTENKYDDNLDIMKFAKKYGVYNSKKEVYDKIDELAPDKYDAFIPYEIMTESLNESCNKKSVDEECDKKSLSEDANNDDDFHTYLENKIDELFADLENGGVSKADIRDAISYYISFI